MRKPIVNETLGRLQAPCRSFTVLNKFQGNVKMNQILVSPRSRHALTPIAITEPVGLTKSVIDFLDHVSYKRMTTEADLDQVFRLRHDNYKAVGHFDGTTDGRYSDELDFVPGVENIGIYVDGALMGSLRLHVLDRQLRQSCAMEIYDHVLNPKLDEGLVMVDTSRFCCDLSKGTRFNALPLAAIRVPGLLAIHKSAHYTLATVTAPHVPFYKRVLKSKDWYDGGIRYPGLTAVVHLLAADMKDLIDLTYTSRQYFWSTPAEREALFGDHPSDGFVSASVRAVVYGNADHHFHS